MLSQSDTLLNLIQTMSGSSRQTKELLLSIIAAHTDHAKEFMNWSSLHCIVLSAQHHMSLGDSEIYLVSGHLPIDR